MMTTPLSQFPTIGDMQQYLSLLVEEGLGDRPIQVLVVPDITLQAIARFHGQRPGDKPALMIDYPVSDRRMPVSVLSMDRWTRGSGT